MPAFLVTAFSRYLRWASQHTLAALCIALVFVILGLITVVRWL